MTTQTLESLLATKKLGAAIGATDPAIIVAVEDPDGNAATIKVDADGYVLVTDPNGGGGGGGGDASAANQVTGNISLASIDTKMTTLAGYVDTLETLIAATNSALGTVNSALTGLGTNTDGLETLVAATNAALGTVNSALTALQGYSDGIEGLIGTTNSTLTSLDGRVDGLEALITTLNGYADGLETLITATNAALSTIDGRVDGIEALIGTTNALVTTLNSYVDGLEALAAAPIPAGTNLIGKVGIDQTTPGTTDRVTAGAPAVATQNATISSGASLSGAIDLGAGRILSTIHVPASFEGGYLEFDVATASAGTYTPMKDIYGTAIRYVAASSTVIRVDPQQFIGIQYLKLRSTDSSGVNTNQSGDATVGLVAA